MLKGRESRSLSLLRWGFGIRSQKGKRGKKKFFFFFFFCILLGERLLSFRGGIPGEFLGFGGRKVLL